MSKHEDSPKAPVIPRVLNASESDRMIQLIELYSCIKDEWGLLSNVQELTAAVHVIHGFIIQHALNRISPAEFGGWYPPF